jgi:hypothetical protein
MPATFTNVPLPAVGSSPVVIYGRGGRHVAQGRDWTHRGSNGGGGAAGGAAGERRRRSHGGAPTSARISTNCGEMWVNKRPWKHP